MQTEWNFDAVNSAQEIILKPGKYKLECWGARGGATGTPLSDGFYYGKGGYCSGELTLRKKTALYVYVGFDGKKGSQFNGAGYCGSATGGGATDIRLVDGNWDNPQGLLSRIIVAGGGGGTRDRYTAGSGGGLKGGIGRDFNGSPSHGGTQFEGGKGKYDDGSLDGSFGKGCAYPNPSAGSGSGGGWFGGAGGGGGGSFGSGGGSGYVLTKDSYKPPGYTPTSEYYFDNVVMTTGGNTTVVGDYSDGHAKITLLQALPFLNISSYNSTTATFKADHTDPTLLTKIEYFIDDVLKETITTDLTTEKTINYTLEDNALHTLKIVVTDSNNATAEKVLSISKNIMPLPENINLNDISTKLTEVNAGFKVGKTSIINTLALKNIDSSLNNTLVELSEKIKESFDSSDASVQELQNIITQKNNTITQLNTQLGQRKRWAKGTFDQTKIKNGSTTIPMNLSFTPTIIFVTCGLEFNFTYASAWRCSLKFFTNLVKTNPTALKGNDENFSGVVLASVEGISRNSFVLSLKNLSGNGSTAEISAISGTTFNWTAIE
ncbi:glycine-rich protein [Clostridioides difficile]|nr:glycine-rich protein [Clostridioides difficile]